MPVRRPATHSDVGFCLLRYASGMASMGSKGAFTVESFDKDGHKSLISLHKKFSYKRKEAANLREECLRLVCRISHKNQIPPYPFEWQKKDAYAAVPQQLSSQEA